MNELEENKHIFYRKNKIWSWRQLLGSPNFFASYITRGFLKKAIETFFFWQRIYVDNFRRPSHSVTILGLKPLRISDTYI